MTRRNGRRHETTAHDEVFGCARCGRLAPGRAPGTRHRNHCPHCLSSLHLDVRTGDRRSGCHGLMMPIAVWVKDDGEWALVHRCTRCGKVDTNRVAGDDDTEALHAIALRPLGTGRPLLGLDLGTG